MPSSLLKAGLLAATTLCWPALFFPARSSGQDLRPKADLKGHADGVYFVAFSADGKELISASCDGPIKIRNLTTGKDRATIKGSGKPVSLSADGKVLAVVDARNSNVNLYELPAFKERSKLGPWPGIQSLAVLVDGERLAFGTAKMGTLIWDPFTNKRRMSMGSAFIAVTATTFSADEQYLAVAAADHHVCLWDWAREKEIAKLPEHFFPTTALAFSPDSQTLATASRFRKPFQVGQEQDLNPDSNIQLWDSATGKERLAISKVPGRVMALAFTADGNLLASGSVDATVRVWQAATGKELAVLKGHRGHVLCLAFSPDGKTLASGAGMPVKDKDGYYTAGELKLWDLSAVAK